MNLPQLARKTLESHFLRKTYIPNHKTKQKFKDKKACFVTLTKNNELRGCIGCLEAKKELWQEVQENAINAAFHDSRFLPLEKNELNKIKIEVSVLSKPKKLEYKDEKDLLKKINNKMGIILKKNPCSSTFLPQVWKPLPDKIKFLEHLSLKAGLNKDGWKNAEIWFYKVEVTGE